MPPHFLFCSVCGVSCPHYWMKEHEQGRKHQRKLKPKETPTLQKAKQKEKPQIPPNVLQPTQSSSPTSNSPPLSSPPKPMKPSPASNDSKEKPPSPSVCSVCNIPLDRPLEYHIKSQIHQKSLESKKVDSIMKEMERDKGGLSILQPSPILWNIDIDAKSNSTFHFQLQCRNSSSSPRVLTAMVFKPTAAFLPTLIKPMDIPCKATISIPISLKFPPTSLQSALHRIVVVFSFDKSTFSISRRLELSVSPASDRETLKKISPSAPFQTRRIEKTKIGTTLELTAGGAMGTANIIEGERPKFDHSVKYPRSLATFPIPKWLISGLSKYGDITKLITPLFDKQLSLDNYVDRFHTLLYLEEAAQQLDICAYDTHDSFTKAGRLLKLEVPGLAESRPSLAVGDAILVCKEEFNTMDIGSVNGKKAKKFLHRGFVHQIQQCSIFVSFHQRFHDAYINGQKYWIRFTFNRITMRRQHQALDLVKENKEKFREILFPRLHPNQDEKKDEKTGETADNTAFLQRLLSLPALSYYDRKKNAEQKLALLSIVSHCHRPYPYIIDGPPGTGKTQTLVELIKQIKKMKDSKGENTRILLMTPSNAAADLLCTRLQPHLKAPCIARVNALSRSPEDVAPEVLDVSFLSTDRRSFIIPVFERLGQAEVIITTCASSGGLYNMGFPPSVPPSSSSASSSSAPFYFEYLIYDEIAQAEESESLLAISAFIKDPTKQSIIFAGDSHQLGPVVRSTLAVTNGLSMSIQERLTVYNYQNQGVFMDKIKYPCHRITPYIPREHSTPPPIVDEDAELTPTLMNTLITTHPYNPQYMTFLRRNYRSHPALLAVPNHLFYQTRLIPAADPLAVGEFTKCPIFVHNDVKQQDYKGFPLLFHSIKGEEKRESSSPSWFNPQECLTIVDYVKQILSYKQSGITPDQIGIITPYRKQAQKIRIAIKEKMGRSCDEMRLQVSSVEEFQGQERRVILISTVRSQIETWESFDQRFSLGFIKEEKRMNVALTRAKSACIVVGNGRVLGIDTKWRYLMDFCKRYGAYVGDDYGGSDGDIKQEGGAESVMQFLLRTVEKEKEMEMEQKASPNSPTPSPSPNSYVRVNAADSDSEWEPIEMEHGDKGHEKPWKPGDL